MPCNNTVTHIILKTRCSLVLQLDSPAQSPCLNHLAMCSSLCNDSILQYNPDKDSYEKIGESTEVALRVLAEKVCVSVNSFFSRICFHNKKNHAT